MPFTKLITPPAVVIALLASACANKPATIVMLPDTQFYSEKNPEIFHDQTRWIAEHIDEENIRFVTHVGDVVQNYDQVEAEWVAADAAMDRLNGLLPWGVAIGNHDYDLGPTANPSDKRNHLSNGSDPKDLTAKRGLEALTPTASIRTKHSTCKAGNSFFCI